MRNTEVVTITNEALQLKEDNKKAAVVKPDPRQPINTRPSVQTQQNPIARQDSSHQSQAPRMDIERRS